MGRHQTEVAYLKSVLIWLQGIGPGQTRRVSIRLERSSKRRGTVLFGGLTLR